MNDKEQKIKAREFTEFWKNKGYEKGQSAQFWTHLISSVYGISEPEKYLEFEDQVMMDKSTGFIDVYIPSTKVLIEQKSIEKDLRKAIKQSDGSLLTPFQQAKKYIADLPVSKHPKWVITCNFKSFLIYDMENPNGEPQEILLENLEKEYYRLQFLVDAGKENPYLAVMVSVLGVCAQMERENITYRLNSGRAKYIADGGKLGRKVGSVKSKERKQEEYSKVIRSLRNGKSIRDTAAICSVSISTVQRVKKEFQL